MDSRWWHRLGQLSNWWWDKVLGWKVLSALPGGFGSSQESLTQHEAVKYRNWKASWDCVVLSRVIIVCRSFGEVLGRFLKVISMCNDTISGLIRLNLSLGDAQTAIYIQLCYHRVAIELLYSLYSQRYIAFISCASRQG